MIYKNNKTENLYTIISFDAIDCTNINDGKRMVIYKDYNELSEFMFVREYDEFINKFTKYIKD